MFSVNQFKRILLILVSVCLIVSFSASCIKIARPGETKASEQQSDNKGQNPVSSLMTKVADKIKGGVMQKDGSPAQSTAQNGGKTRPHPPVRTGEISLGQKVDVSSQSIGSAGGTLSVSKPGDPLDEFVINIPAQSYAGNTAFKVSHAPINGHTFGSDINPVSPMITVDNGGGYSENIMHVRVPVKVPDGHFAMGFIYDEASRQLEGMPLVGMDDKSVTIATRHFSSFFISMIEKALLQKDIDSGFQPGIDDWQFTNYGSYIAPGGHCEGQALTAMWYYCTEPDGQGMCLYDRYDNNGKKPATPELWQDDSLGYRFCSVIQKEPHLQFTDRFWTNFNGKQWKWENNKWQMEDVPGIGAENIYNLFAYSIRATGEPQEVGIWSSTGGGHAMIVYKIVGNALYIADPNYPGDTGRRIIYYSGEKQFKPYNSGANRKAIEAGGGEAYEHIEYLAKTTVVPWNTIKQHWKEFKNGTIGNDKFPNYRVIRVEPSGARYELTDGYTSDSDELRVVVEAAGNTANFGWAVIRDGVRLRTDDSGNYKLNPDDNKLGIFVVAKVNDSDEYVDFKYLNVRYEAGDCKVPPKRILDRLQKTNRFLFTLSEVPVTVETGGTWTNMIPRNFNKISKLWAPKPRDLDFGSITWSGANFRFNSLPGYNDTLSGSVCYSDGQLFVSFDYVDPDPNDSVRISVKNLPVDIDDLQSSYSDPAVAQKSVKQLEYKLHDEYEKITDIVGGQKYYDTVYYDIEVKKFDCSQGCAIFVLFDEIDKQ